MFTWAGVLPASVEGPGDMRLRKEVPTENLLEASVGNVGVWRRDGSRGNRGN
jgi:hypothetical protein